VRNDSAIGERWTTAHVDHDAVAHNVGLLAGLAAPAATWVVVKANGYGHGAVEIARTVLAAGASGLCVALVQEGVELRRAGVTAPVLVLSEQPPEQSAEMCRHGLTPTLCSVAGVESFAHAARRLGRSEVDVHVKVDTGMHRMGAEADEVPAVLEAVASSNVLRLAGMFTHLARADEPTHPMNATQLERFDAVVEQARRNGHSPAVVHVANSAATLALPSARRDMVRVGIAVYGIVPGHGIVDLCGDLRPALQLRSRVSRVARVRAGEGVSYGHRYVCPVDTTIVTVPIGYADGVPRQLSDSGEVLVGGRRRRLAGVVTMDQLMVECGDDAVAVGDEVVLLGRQGEEEIRPEEWAERVGTIGYEIVCGLSSRVARHHTGHPR
jgi:alanine racemase